MNATTIGIAGVGLIGGSIGLRARALGMRVIGFDRDAAVIARAVERNAIDEVATAVEQLAAAETVIVALPVDAVPATLALLAACPGPRLVIDVASVKLPLQRFAGVVVNYVGTHPMAGRERGGVDHADAGLFTGATWAYVPVSDAELAARVRAFIDAMGARPLEIAAADHDAVVALTSHLPQALAVTLAAELAPAMESDARVRELCGPGMMSMLRIARSPAATWSPIFSSNAVPLARHLRSTAKALIRAANALEQGDTSPLMSYFEAARGVTAALEERYPTVERP